MLTMYRDKGEFEVIYQYMNNESECFTGISKREKTMYENTSAKREWRSVWRTCLSPLRSQVQISVRTSQCDSNPVLM